MIETLTILLRLAGASLVLLAGLHIPIGRHLKWREDSTRLTPPNAAIFRVHSFFIGLVLVMMGLPCLIEPRVFLEPSHAGSWLAWSFAAFWAIRLYFQWFVFPADLRRGKRLETILHWWFTVYWTSLTALFTVCGAVQAGWLH
jgi:hypothetical protein